TNDQLSFSFSTSYRDLRLSYTLIKDLRVEKDLQRSLNLEYRGACWSFGALVRSIYDGTRGKYISEAFLTFNIFDLQRFTVPLKR
ncbi:MAG: LPS-assembly protein LptD, partial [Aquificota bacterium]